MSLPNSSAQEAVSRAQAPGLPRAPARRWSSLIKRGIKPSRHPDAARPSRTRSRSSIALGGSTNAVLHLLAIAHAARRAR